MAHYETIPEEIEAICYTGPESVKGTDAPQWAKDALAKNILFFGANPYNPDGPELLFLRKRYAFRIQDGGYIIRKKNGELTNMAQEGFEKRYRPVHKE